jgi:hypothetical protein
MLYHALTKNGKVDNSRFLKRARDGESLVKTNY